jgi:hypothetical protein
MFQLMMAIMAIALSGVLAAATIYYGGPLFTGSATSGVAVALINGGEQIAAAQTFFNLNHASNARSVTDLGLHGSPFARRYVTAGWALTPTGSNAYVALNAKLAPKICDAVEDAGGVYDKTDTVVTDETVAAAFADEQFGCIGNYFVYSLM